MALSQSGLLEILDAIREADVADRVRESAATIYKAFDRAELTSVIGAEADERSDARTGQRNGHRPRVLSTTRVTWICGSRSCGPGRSSRRCWSGVAGPTRPVRGDLVHNLRSRSETASQWAPVGRTPVHHQGRSAVRSRGFWWPAAHGTCRPSAGMCALCGPLRLHFWGDVDRQWRAVSRATVGSMDLYRPGGAWKPPRMCSRWRATSTAVRSSRYGAMTWTPMGRPLGVSPAGATAAGR